MRLLTSFSLAALALSFSLYAFAADVPISPEARNHFKAGVALLQDPGGARYEEAYREFTAAYKDSPSPRILGNVGLCAMKLERDQEAITAYEGYLAGVPDLSADEKKQVSTDLATLKTQLVHATLKVNVDGATVVDVRTPVQGSPVTNTYGPVHGSIDIGLHAGNHALTVKLQGYPNDVWEVEAPAGGKLEHSFTLKKPIIAPTPTGGVGATPSPNERPVPKAVFVVGALSGAAIVGGAVTGILALGKNSDFKKANDGTDPTAADSLKSSGKTLNLVTDILLGAGIVGAGVTVALYATRPAVTNTGAAPSSPSAKGPWLAIDVGPMRAGLSGAF
jgi:hypothetical protein